MTCPSSCKVEGCTLSYAAHLRDIRFAAAAMPTRKGGVIREEKKEQQLSADLPAYKRLRHNGTQPPGIDGAAELEKRANDKVEVEMGRAIPKPLMSRVKDGFAMSAEAGFGKGAA